MSNIGLFLVNLVVYTTTINAPGINAVNKLLEICVKSPGGNNGNQDDEENI